MNIYKHVAKASTIYAVAVFAPFVVSFFMLPVYTRYLSPADYGLLELLDTTRNIFSMLVGGRFAEALFYYYAQANSDQHKREVIGTILWGSILVGAAAATIGAFISPSLSQIVFGNRVLSSYLTLALVGFAISLPAEAGLACYRVEDRPRAYVAISLARVATTVVCTVTFVVVLRMGVNGLLWSSILSSSIFGAALLGVHFIQGRTSLRIRLFWQMLTFSVPLGVGSIAYLIIHSGDRFFLQRVTSLEQVGIYGLAYKLGMLVAQAHAAFATYWAANMYKLLKGDEGAVLFKRVNTYLMLTLLYCGLLILGFASPFIHIATPARYAACLQYVPGILAAYIIRSQADYVRMLILVERRVVLDAGLLWVTAGFCLAAYALMIPRWTLWGAVAATFSTFVVLLVLSCVVAYRLRPFSLEYGRLAWIYGIALGLGSIAYFLQSRPVWITIPAGIAIAVLYPTLLWFSGFLLESEKRAARLGWKRLVGLIRAGEFSTAGENY